MNRFPAPARSGSIVLGVPLFMVAGPVHVVDPNNPQDVETLDWMLLSAARALAEENGYEFTEE